MKITQEQFDTARAKLSAFIIRKADQIQKQIGFGYVDSDNAPGDFESLLTAYRSSKRTGFALPVWSGCSDNTAYTSRGANYAFRFWHDVLHCVHGLGFNLADEVAIGHMHVAEVKAYFGPDSIEAMIMYADTVRQSQYEAVHGKFPDNQYAFVHDFVIYPITSEIVFSICPQ